MKIRKAKAEDYIKISNLRKKTFEEINSRDYTERIVREINKKNPPKTILEKMKKRDMFCLVENEKILGVIDLEKNKIGGLFIRHNCIRKGYGKKLMEFIENHAIKKGIKKTKLYSTKYAYPFYLSLGYKLIKKKEFKIDKVKITTYEMEKNLK